MIESVVISSPIGLVQITGDTDGIQEVTFLADDQNISKTIPDSLSDCVCLLYTSPSPRDA